MKALKFSYLLIISICVGLWACNSPFIPKQRGYFKIDLPAHQYQVFDKPGYPYKFEYPVYARVLQDSTFFEDKAENPWWVNIDFPGFDSRIYISYKQLPQSNFSKLINDAYNMTYKHSLKASSIDDSLMHTSRGINGVMFKVGGNAATATQFYLTDSTRHFLRGALYFNAPPNEDSLKPVNDFLKQDMLHLINSFEWK